jgi:hypothetical protein
MSPKRKASANRARRIFPKANLPQARALDDARLGFYLVVHHPLMP